MGEGKDTYRIVVAKAETEAEGLVEVDGVGVENADVHLPFFEIIGGDEADAWREGLVNLKWRISEAAADVE